MAPVVRVSRAFSSSPVLASGQNRQSSIVPLFWESVATKKSTRVPESLSEFDQGIVGIIGTLASLIVFLYSEFTLKTTGCALPAGPFGILDLAQGLSYSLSVTGLVAYSLVKKLDTVHAMPLWQ